MKNTVLELVEAELELGFEAGICDAEMPDGGVEVQLRRRKVTVHPWLWAKDEPDAVSFLSSFIPRCFYELPHTVQVQHAMPEYVWEMSLPPLMSNALSVALNYPLICEAAVVWSRREAEFWQALDNVPRVEHVPRGVDLAFWKPEGDKIELNFRPQVGFMEASRGSLKRPFTWLFALKHAQRKVKTLRAQWLAVPASESQLWTMLFTKLNLDLVLESFMTVPHPEPWKWYRALDMVVSPCLGGHVSRVGVEALACGCPIIALEGSEEQAATLKCEDRPVRMAEAMLKLWDRIQADGKGVREEARRMAQKHYDVKETARSFVKLAEDLI